MMVQEPAKRRSAGSRFHELGDRLTRTFGGFDRTREELPAWESGAELDYRPGEGIVRRSGGRGRFPVVPEGYDCATVDRQIGELERELVEVERELGELRMQAPPNDAVQAEIDRIGSQTAAVLQAAYEQAAEITRTARQQADKCLSDAAANAIQITEDANRRLRDLDVETDSVWQERARLIDDARGVATALFSLAEDASARFPAEAEKYDQRTEEVGPPTVAAEPEGVDEPPADET
jgi:cell division septum initiation protein DivIVA